MPSPSPDDAIPLPQLVRELREASDLLELEQDALQRVTYHRARGAVLDGLLPAEKIGREWYVRRRNLAEVAQVLGLQSKRKPGRPRKASSPSNAAVAA